MIFKSFVIAQTALMAHVGSGVFADSNAAGCVVSDKSGNDMLNVVQIETGAIKCEGNSRCKEFVINGCEEVICEGDLACLDASIHDFMTLKCNGTRSCGGSVISSNQGEGEIFCDGMEACAETDVDFPNGHLRCQGPNACEARNRMSVAGIHCHDGLHTCTVNDRLHFQTFDCGYEEDVPEEVCLSNLTATNEETGEESNRNLKGPITEEGIKRNLRSLISPSVEGPNHGRHLNCEDRTLNGNTWNDSYGTRYNCNWYASQSWYCTSYGYWWRNQYTASEACCACGGGVREPTRICDHDIPSDIDSLLNPPSLFRDILNVGLGVSYGYGPIDGDDRSDACTSLADAMGDHDYVYVDITNPSEVADQFVSGTDADDENTARSGSSTSAAYSRFSNALSAVGEYLPICVAMRPCGVEDPAGTWGQEVTFGAYMDPGITVSTSLCDMTLYGVAVSTAGDLTPPDFTADLWDESVPEGMHAWISGGISLPFGKTPMSSNFRFDEYVSMEVTGQMGVYGEINGSPNIGSWLNRMFSNGFNPTSSSVQSWRRTGTGRFQIFGDLDVVVTLSPEELIGSGDHDIEFSLGGMSAMLDFWLSSHYASTYVDLRLSRRASNEGMVEAIQEAITDKLSMFGEDLATMVAEAATGMIPVSTIEQKMMLRITGGSISFGFELSFETTMNCNTYSDIINGFADAIQFFAGDQNALTREVIGPVQDVLNAICGRPVSLSIKLEFSNGSINTGNTCFTATIGGNDYSLCMNQFPSCPGPRSSGQSCSANADCRGSTYRHGGYCRNHRNFHTSIGCLGQCIHKRADGQDCSDEWARLPIPQRADFTNAEHIACRSGYCICGVCANTAGKVPNGSYCSANSDCQSGYCRGWVSADCNGVCTRKAYNGESCSPEAAQEFMGAILPSEAAHNFCQSGRCWCSTCSSSSGFAFGERCDTDAACAGGACYKTATTLVGCNGYCGTYQYRFEMDLNSRHGWDGSGGTNNRVKIEFYYSNGNMGCYHNYWSGFGTGWYNVEGCYGNSYRVDYVVVKIFGDDAMGIDQCGFYSKRGHDIGWTQRRWFGQENHGSYWISSDANDTVGNRRPCKIFMMAGANAGQNYHCGTMNSVWGLDGLVVWGAY